MKKRMMKVFTMILALCVLFSAFPMIASAAECADGHHWSEPVWTWNVNMYPYSARADFTCADCGETVRKMTMNVSETDRADAKTVYTASFELDNGTYYTTADTVGGSGKFPVITIDCGDIGEDIEIEVPRGSNFFEAVDNAGVFETLDAMENGDYIFRDLATKPLSEFSDLEEFNEDAGALLDMTVDSDMTVYAAFYTKIKRVALTLEQPTAGTTVTLTDGFQSPAPVLSIEEGANYSLYIEPDYQYSQWYTISNDDYRIFEGTFEKDATYCVDCMLTPDFGYWLDENTIVTANGASVDEVLGRMMLTVTLSAQAVSPVILGDADGNGMVDVVDATILQRHLSNITVPYPKTTLMNADVDGDGVLTVIDTTLIQRFCARIHTPYRIGEPK